MSTQIDTLRGSLMQSLRMGIIPTAGQLKVGMWDTKFGFRKRAANYHLVTVHGIAVGSKEDLLNLANHYGIDVLDSTNGR